MSDKAEYMPLSTVELEDMPLNTVDSEEVPLITADSEEYIQAHRGSDRQWLLKLIVERRIAVLAFVAWLLTMMWALSVVFSYSRITVQGSKLLAIESQVHDVSRYLNGPPLNNFRENLKQDVKYVTAWNFAGMTNDFMVYCNLIYLAIVSSRVPIIPPFVPAAFHLGSGGLIEDFSEFFDLPSLRTSLHQPIIEWSQVKKAAYSGNELGLEDVIEEPFGCWSNWVAFGPDKKPSRSILPDFLKLDLSYTPSPSFAKLVERRDMHSSFWGLSAMMYPDGRSKALKEKSAVPSYGPHQNQSLLPDDQLACFDILYFTTARVPYEWETDYAPVWNQVGKHVRFSQKVEDVAMFYLRKVFNVARNKDVPPFISVHVRRTDFAARCPKGAIVEDCFPPLSLYGTEIEQVKAELSNRHGPDSPLSNVTHILVTSDEKDNDWWSSVRDQGWYFIDHGKEQTSKVHGNW
ncbi:hypothetical protein FRC03_006517 [Tulasnella sp. 419]|nr:hypothetical protein FRC03_006517 [Tulasnella sp. 419]